jgi:hypothetical protein
MAGITQNLEEGFLVLKGLASVADSLESEVEE